MARSRSSSYLRCVRFEIPGYQRWYLVNASELYFSTYYSKYSTRPAKLFYLCRLSYRTNHHLCRHLWVPYRRACPPHPPRLLRASCARLINWVAPASPSPRSSHSSYWRYGWQAWSPKPSFDRGFVDFKKRFKIRFVNGEVRQNNTHRWCPTVLSLVESLVLSSDGTLPTW